MLSLRLFRLLSSHPNRIPTYLSKRCYRFTAQGPQSVNSITNNTLDLLAGACLYQVKCDSTQLVAGKSAQTVGEMQTHSTVVCAAHETFLSVF